MLRIQIPLSESFDESTSRFIVSESIEFDIEHSLVSLSKWESKYERAFLSEQPKTIEETLDYVRMMTLTPEVPPEAYGLLNGDNVKDINEYLNAKMTASFVAEDRSSPSRPETVTSELIYYWMSSLQIPFDRELWHLNKLLMLVKVISLKNQAPKKSSRADLARKHREMNAQRKAELGTSG